MTDSECYEEVEDVDNLSDYSYFEVDQNGALTRIAQPEAYLLERASPQEVAEDGDEGEEEVVMEGDEVEEYSYLDSTVDREGEKEFPSSELVRIKEKWVVMEGDKVEEYSYLDSTVDRDGDDQEFTLSELGKINEFKKINKRPRRQYFVAFAGILFICAAIVITIIVLFGEKNRIRGMVFESRTEVLPLPLPKGQLQLRNFMLPFATTRGNFTPFIASSQSLGRLDVVTNATHPAYNAYFVEHPGIQDVTMITDDFYCSKSTCFFLADAHNDAFFETDTVVRRNITYQLVEVPLPAGYRFISAQYCSFKNDYLPFCSILLEDTDRSLRFGSLTKNGPIPLIQLRNNTRKEAIKAFHFSSKVNRTISWKDSRLAVFSPDQPQVVAFIEDVEADENVEILAVGDSVQIILVMKDEGDSTRQV